MLAVALVGAIGALLIIRRTSMARDLVQLHGLQQRTRERVVVALGVGLLGVAMTLAVEALTG